MLFEPDIVLTLLKQMDGWDAIFNGYALRSQGIGLAGAGCVMLGRKVFDRLHMRCLEFKMGK